MSVPEKMLRAARLPIIAKAEAAVNQAEELRATAIAEGRASCSHELVVEGSYYPGNWCGSALPPFRICCGCGIEEDGWGSGYKILRNTDSRIVAEVDRHDAYSYRTAEPAKEQPHD